MGRHTLKHSSIAPIISLRQGLTRQRRSILSDRVGDDGRTDRDLPTQRCGGILGDSRLKRRENRRSVRGDGRGQSHTDGKVRSKGTRPRAIQHLRIPRAPTNLRDEIQRIQSIRW